MASALTGGCQGRAKAGAGFFCLPGCAQRFQHLLASAMRFIFVCETSAPVSDSAVLASASVSGSSCCRSETSSGPPRLRLPFLMSRAFHTRTPAAAGQTGNVTSRYTVGMCSGSHCVAVSVAGASAWSLQRRKSSSAVGSCMFGICLFTTFSSALRT